MKIVDMHADTIVAMYKSNQHLNENTLHLDKNKMLKGDYLLQNMAIFLDSRNDKDITNLAKKIIKVYEKETDLNNINRVYKYEDIKKDSLNTMLTIEDSAIVPFNELQEFYDLGVRMITLTWNYPNEVGYPNLDGDNCNSFEDLKRVDTINGLKPNGIEYIKKMEELKIIVDVSHGSNKLVEDVLKHSTKPFVASHSNSYSVTPVGRNLSDKLILQMIERQCVIGMNFLSEFICDKNDNNSSIEDLLKHVDHILDLGGENSLGFGLDLDGINSILEIKDSSNIQQVIKAMESRYSSNIVKKISHENVLSLYEKLL